MGTSGTTRLRLERLIDERERIFSEIQTVVDRAERDVRTLTAAEDERLTRQRIQVTDMDTEIEALASDVERYERSRSASRLIRGTDAGEEGTVYRTFAQFARDELIVRYPLIAEAAVGNAGISASGQREIAGARLERAVEHTLSSDVAGLLPPTHVAQIMDIINGSRPVVSSGKQMSLSTGGKLTYPKVTQRPEVLKQSTEKTEAGTAKMEVEMADVSAETYLGAGNLSWQTINWSTPDALQTWFDLAAEAYARKTEEAAGAEVAGTAVGTISPSLGTAGTEDFGAWRDAVLAAVSTIYTATSGRARTNVLYVSSDRFFQLAGLSTTSPLQLSAVGGVDVGGLSGTFSGLRVIGSYGLDPNTAVVGDSSALLVAETPGAPVQLRAVEPAIGGMEVGVIGAFRAKLFDPDRFIKLS